MAKQVQTLQERLNVTATTLSQNADSFAASAELLKTQAASAASASATAAAQAVAVEKALGILVDAGVTV